MKVFKKILESAIVLACLVVLIFSGMQIYDFLTKKADIEHKNADVRKINTLVSDDGTFTFSHDIFNQYKSLYPNFVGWMAFEDEFVSEPVMMHPTDDSFYLKHWIDGSYSDEGAVYFATGTDLANDQNCVMYGHKVEYDSKAKFSPLTTLVEQANYDEHHEFKIWYEDYVRTYDITNVLYYDSENDTDFQMTNNMFEINEFTAYKSYINAHDQINGVDEISREDRWVTIQTCRNAGSAIRVILICKEVACEEYE